MANIDDMRDEGQKILDAKRQAQQRLEQEAKIAAERKQAQKQELERQRQQRERHEQQEFAILLEKEGIPASLSYLSRGRVSDICAKIPKDARKYITRIYERLVTVEVELSQSDGYTRWGTETLQYYGYILNIPDYGTIDIYQGKYLVTDYEIELQHGRYQIKAGEHECEWEGDVGFKVSLAYLAESKAKYHALIEEVKIKNTELEKRIKEAAQERSAAEQERAMARQRHLEEQANKKLISRLRRFLGI